MDGSTHFFGFALSWLLASSLSAQPNFPSDLQLKNLHGKLVGFSTVAPSDSLTLVCFWSTSSEESIAELNAINANFQNWQKSVSFHLIAVAVDEGTVANMVRPTVNMYEWKFAVFTDFSGELRRTLNQAALPESLILRKGKVLYQQSGYEAGSEKYLFEKLTNIAAGRS
jgi:hypothetical protein